MKKLLPLALALTFAALPAAQAADDDWQVKVGVHTVDPKSDNGHLAGGALKSDVGSGTSLTFTIERRFAPEWGVEVLAALPFEHDVRLNGVKAAKVKHLPPTVSIQWHFLPESKFDPFLGLGLNYTRFFSIDERGPLAGTHLDLSDSWGLAAHAGIDYRFDARWSFTADVRWMQISTDAKVDGAKVGTVDIDPFVYGVAVGYRF